jgi:prepilin-type N-terminal cleavage/methylation domain-containing protein
MRERFTAKGFSLIEVSLAIFVVALGMLTLFSLFPAGLKQVETAQSSTQEAMFAEHVFSTLRAKAMALKEDEWNDLTAFRPPFEIDKIVKVKYPADSDPARYMRYMLGIADAGGGLRSLSLWCRSGEFGAVDVAVFKTGAAKFYTELFYSGMP